jgi:hypothetical protein
MGQLRLGEGGVVCDKWLCYENLDGTRDQRSGYVVIAPLWLVNVQDKTAGLVSH